MSNAFVFYESIFEARQKMSANEALALYDAICYYFFRREKQEVPAIVEAVLDVALPTLEAAYKRHQQACNAGKARWDKKPRVAEEPPQEQPEQPPVQAQKPRRGSAPVDPTEKQPAQPAKTPAEPPTHRLGTMCNVILSEEEYQKLQNMEDWKTTVNRFGLYKLNHGFSLLRDYEALLHFKKHGMIPKGKFERPPTYKTAEEIFEETFGKT